MDQNTNTVDMKPNTTTRQTPQRRTHGSANIPKWSPSAVFSHFSSGSSRSYDSSDILSSSGTRSSDGSIQHSPAFNVIAQAQETADEKKELPARFYDADPEDLFTLISSMLLQLISHNDTIPLHPADLTRFHSRAPPGISVEAYLRRLAKYTTLDKPCMLIILIYIDRVCERMDGFTICSLTVHRFLCASVVCANKALCDSFSTNTHYARVGGISLVEMNLLEKEFLNVIDWRLMVRVRDL